MNQKHERSEPSSPQATDDYGLRATGRSEPTTGLRQSLSWHHLVGVSFFAVCGGDYGIEDSVGAGGPAFTLIGVVVLPVIWSLPIAVMTAELGAMIPETGGYIVWVHRAFGVFWAQQNAVWSLVSNTFDNALYPVMFVDYLYWFPALRLTGLLRWFVSVLMLAAVTLLNLVGVDVVASASNLFAVLVISPFVALFVAGVTMIQPSTWAQGLDFPTGEPPVRWGAFLSVLLWNTSGYDSVGALAAEVHDPGRDFPRALTVTILLVTLVYLLPLRVAITLDAEHVRDWSDGHFVRVASDHVGDWLAAWITLGGALSAVGLLNTLLCTSARVAVSAAKLHILPSALARVHEGSGTPRIATCCLAVVLALACALPFSKLVSISMLFYGATTFMEFLALIRLRHLEPLTRRPYRVPLERGWLVAMCLPPMSLCILLVCLAPWEAWLLFGASALLGILASLRTSDACPSWCVQFTKITGISPVSPYGTLVTSAVRANQLEQTCKDDLTDQCSTVIAGPLMPAQPLIEIEIAPAAPNIGLGQSRDFVSFL